MTVSEKFFFEMILAGPDPFLPRMLRNSRLPKRLRPNATKSSSGKHPFFFISLAKVEQLEARLKLTYSPARFWGFIFNPINQKNRLSANPRKAAIAILGALPKSRGQIRPEPSAKMIMK
jgi:hypothetical protein